MYNILYGNQKNINLLVSFGVFSFEYHFENRKNELKRVGEVIPFFKSVFRNTKKLISIVQELGIKKDTKLIELQP